MTSTDLLAPPSARELDTAELYERHTSLYDGWRDHLVERLGLRRGDTVLDVSCGSGLNLAALRERVGPHGRIVGIEESPELLSVARYRVRRRGWHNVELLSAPPTAAELPTGADAALLCAADEVLQSPSRLAYLVTRLRPNARVAAGGWKLPPEWMFPLRYFFKTVRRTALGAAPRLDEPWRLLGEHAPALTVDTLGFGTGYLAHGNVRA